jgi:O-antigen/teichoic acid export membrane protein
MSRPDRVPSVDREGTHGVAPDSGSLVTPNLTSGRILVRGAAWNLLGQSLPVIAAFLFVPRLVRGLGIDRFGILSLAWMLIGYFSLFDLGMGGALTRMVAQRVAARRQEEVPPLVWTSLVLTTAMGLVGTLVVASSAPWLVSSVLKVPAVLRSETVGLLTVLAISLPVVTGTAALAGTLAAQQRFGVLNAIRVPLGIFTYCGPLLMLPFSHSLLPVAIVLALGRFIAGLCHLWACLAVTPGLGRKISVDSRLIRPLASFGGWMTVTSIVGPLMVYMDRFLIGSMLSMAMVAYYTTPYDLTSRMWILCTPISAVLLPAFAACSQAETPRATRLFEWGLRAVALLLFPVSLLLVTFAHEILLVWLGADFAIQGAQVLRLLAVGMFINGLAAIALALVQGSGRPDLGARLHLAELPLYLVAVWILIRAHGIEGAAIAWLGRVILDAIALFFLAARQLPGRPVGLARLAPPAGVALLLLVVGWLVPALMARAIFAAIVLGLVALIGWRRIVVPGLQVLRELSPTPMR